MSSQAPVSDPVQIYNDNGFVIFRHVLPQEVVNQASCHVEWLQRQHPTVDPELLEHWYMREDPFWISLITYPPLLDIGKRLIN